MLKNINIITDRIMTAPDQVGYPQKTMNMIELWIIIDLDILLGAAFCEFDIRDKSVPVYGLARLSTPPVSPISMFDY